MLLKSTPLSAYSQEQGLLLGVGRYDANGRRHVQLRQLSQLRQYRLGLGPVPFVFFAVSALPS